MGQACLYQPVTRWGRTTEPILLRFEKSGKGDRLDCLMSFGQADRLRVGVLSRECSCVVKSERSQTSCQARLPAKHICMKNSHTNNISIMAPTATSPGFSTYPDPKIVPLSTSKNDSGHLLSKSAEPDQIAPLRAALTSEATPLAVRFRALFSLKHYASEQPPTAYTLPAIHAIAAALSSPSALLKHELAYCLGQTSNLAAVPFLRTVLDDRGEDAMCRHEAAEALGALGDWESLGLLRTLRDEPGEAEVVRETCEIAVGRIEWEHSERRKSERLRIRWDIPSDMAVGANG